MRDQCVVVGAPEGSTNTPHAPEDATKTPPTNEPPMPPPPYVTMARDTPVGRSGPPAQARESGRSSVTSRASSALQMHAKPGALASTDPTTVERSLLRSRASARAFRPSPSSIVSSPCANTVWPRCSRNAGAPGGATNTPRDRRNARPTCCRCAERRDRSCDQSFGGGGASTVRLPLCSGPLTTPSRSICSIRRAARL